MVEFFSAGIFFLDREGGKIYENTDYILISAPVVTRIHLIGKNLKFLVAFFRKISGYLFFNLPRH